MGFVVTAADKIIDSMEHDVQVLFFFGGVFAFGAEDGKLAVRVGGHRRRTNSIVLILPIRILIQPFQLLCLRRDQRRQHNLTPIRNRLKRLPPRRPLHRTRKLPNNHPIPHIDTALHPLLIRLLCRHYQPRSAESPRAFVKGSQFTTAPSIRKK